MREDEREEEEKWNRYHEKTLHRPPEDLLLKALGHFDGFTGYSIDIGCGSGRDTKELLRRGWRVLAIDGNSYSFDNIKSTLDEKQLAKLEMQKERFENLRLPKADLINASWSILFCKPEYFAEFWSTIVDAINVNGRFSGNFLGNRDEWIHKKNGEMTFFDKKGVLELFQGFKIEHFEEREYDKKTGQGYLKHWHLFNVIAKKKEIEGV